jgi:hypothetical protein
VNLVDRAKKICLSPATEWPVIEQEATSAATLISSYVVPLAGASAVASFIGVSLVGQSLSILGTFRVPIASGLGMAVFGFAMAIVSVFVVSAIVTALAPSFGANKDSVQATKVTVYSFTPAWAAGVLQILPALGPLVLLASLYSVYLLYLGLQQLMKAPADKAVGYTAVVVICTIVLSAVIGAITGSIGAVGLAGVGALP